MAGKPKLAIPALPPHLRRVVPFGIAGIAFLLGLVLLWQGFQGWRQDSLEPELRELRDQTAKRVDEQLDTLRRQLGVAVADEYVIADAAAGELADAAGRVEKEWKELRDATFYQASLDDAFAQSQTIGYARLALLNEAVDRGAPSADLIMIGKQPAIGLAAPVMDGGARVAVAFGWLPVDTLAKLAEEADAAPGYLALQADSRVVGAAGERGMAGQAGQATPVEDTSMRVVIAAPHSEAMVGGSPAFKLGLGIVALLLGAGLVWQAKRASRDVFEPEPEATFGETLQQAAAAAETPAPVAATAPRRAAPVEERAPAALERSIFRAYDIRGVVGETLDENVARLIGQAIGTLMREQGLKDVVVGRDGRLSGPSLANALIEGLRRAGRDVIDIGMAPTPLVYFGTFHFNTGCGVAVTGSHNPPDYNGFKIVVGGETLSGQAVQDLYARISENRLDGGGGGGLQHIALLDDYIGRVSGDIQLERKLKVVVDAGNGVAGAVAPQLLEAIGAEVIPLHCEVDGTFPAHHPDPSEPQNLSDLINFVGRFGADLGLAFDGDGDRLGVVTRQGEIIFPDRLLMLFAQDVLSRNPGASVIYDVKCTGHLAGQILRHGGSPIMWKTGHSLIKAKMKETDAELAGEMSGHFFFRERWFGFDDAMYSAARLLEILAADERSPSEVLGELPKGASTPELKVPMVEGEHYAFVERFREKAKFEGAKIATIDGVRADWSDGWGLVRCSNTTPCLVLRFDADSAEALQRIQALFRAQLLALDPDLKLPF